MSQRIIPNDAISEVFNLVKYPLPRRFRHHISPNAYIALDKLKEIPPSYPPLIESIDWAKEFAKGHTPDTLDIGCGFGAFLIKNSLSKPTYNHLGLEVREVPVDYIQNVINTEKLTNLLVRRYSVANGLKFIADDSISEIYYFFPDPWYKNKHIKRRAFNMELIAECFRILKRNGGKFYIQTDVEFVNEWHLEIIKQFGKFNIEQLKPNEAWHLTRTNQEETVLKRGFDIFRLVLEKV